MSLASARAWWSARSRWEKFALVVWCSILAFFSVRVFCWPESRTVYPIYSACGALWCQGIDIYAPNRPEAVQGGYRYSPAFAVLCIPFAAFPDAIGGVLWRLGSVAGLIGALIWLRRSVLPATLTRDQFALLVLACLPLSIQSMSNGQANILVAAALVATVAAVHDERWNLAGILIGLAFVCKIYPLALGLLLMVLYPRKLAWRIALTVAASMVLPFAFQSPAYVVDQYQQWIAVLIADDRSQIPFSDMYRDLWLLIRLFEFPVSHKVYLGLEVLSGAAIAALCWYRQRAGWDHKALLISTLALGSAWMMFLGPTTESCTFILLAPSFAWSLVEAVRNGPLNVRCWLLWGSAALFGSVVFAANLRSTIGMHAIGIHSWASLLYFVYLLTEQKSEMKQVDAAQFESWRAAA